jgi:hypothetical protein
MTAHTTLSHIRFFWFFPAVLMSLARSDSTSVTIGNFTGGMRCFRVYIAVHCFPNSSKGTMPIVRDYTSTKHPLQRCTTSSANTCASNSAFLGTRMPRSMQSFPLSGHTLLRFSCLSAGPVGPCTRSARSVGVGSGTIKSLCQAIKRPTTLYRWVDERCCTWPGRKS